ncbi:type VII secretion target [Mycolicibacterium sp. Y3]
MLVDPDVLRALAQQVASASGAITGTKIGSECVCGADSLPGSTTQWATRAVGEHLAKTADQLAGDVSKLGTAVRGAADSFEVEDESLAGSFDGLF